MRRKNISGKTLFSRFFLCTFLPSSSSCKLLLLLIAYLLPAPPISSADIFRMELRREKKKFELAALNLIIRPSSLLSRIQIFRCLVMLRALFLHQFLILRHSFFWYIINFPYTSICLDPLFFSLGDLIVEGSRYSFACLLPWKRSVVFVWQRCV